MVDPLPEISRRCELTSCSEQLENTVCDYDTFFGNIKKSVKSAHGDLIRMSQGCNQQTVAWWAGH